MHKLELFPISFLRLGAALLLGICLQLSSARAGDFCAVTLNVTGPHGEPITSTWIELVDPSGRVVRREMMQGSEHRICDFGFGPHTLRVGTNECLPVAVSNLRAVFGFPLVLHVVLDGCGYQEQMRDACVAYFRTVSEDSAPLSGVRLPPRWAAGGLAQTDSYGRWQGPFRGEQDLTFTKPGFAPTAKHIECRHDEEVDVEVVMRKTPPSDKP